jgi:gliding motility-associated-like protein
MIAVSSLTSHGRFLFSGVNFKNGNQFTFAKFKAACMKDCDSFFTPNGDGITDIYYISDSGKTSIYDRAGRLIKAIATPAYWDGTDEKGELSVPGIYFLVSNDDVQKTVTLIR